MLLDYKPKSILRSLISGNKFRLKKYDFGGVGLGIVAALDKSSERSLALCSRNLSRSDPVPVNSPGNSSRFNNESDDMGMDDFEEDYTVVTCHVPNKTYTKVYYHGDEYDRGQYNRCTKKASVFDISPVRSNEAVRFPASDFLNSCDMCHKKLHGKDIYMYRGERAFCSTECRYRQIVMDERKENCSHEASRSVDVSNSSPYNNKNDNILSTGILAI